MHARLSNTGTRGAVYAGGAGGPLRRAAEKEVLRAGRGRRGRTRLGNKLRRCREPKNSAAENKPAGSSSLEDTHSFFLEDTPDAPGEREQRSVFLTRIDKLLAAPTTPGPADAIAFDRCTRGSSGDPRRDAGIANRRCMNSREHVYRDDGLSLGLATGESLQVWICYQSRRRKLEMALTVMVNAPSHIYS